MNSPTSVRELVQKYRVCYEVANELGPTSGSVRPIGFAIELAGTHDHSPEVPITRCAECAHAAAALQAIAYAALPSESAGVSFRVQEPRIAHHFTPKHENRPDLTATITGYGGPCPPVGKHRYVFKLYALDASLQGLKTPSKTDLERAMEGHVVAKAELVGTYEKKQR